MTRKLEFRIQSQPDDTTCGPACLASVFRFYGDDIGLEEVIAQTPALVEGGTLAVLMGEYALRRGYSVTIVTYNLRVFDPAWFGGEGNWPAEGPAPRPGDFFPDRARLPCVDLVEKLGEQRLAKKSVKLQMACTAYIDFISAGGHVLMHELNADVLRFYLNQERPILTGLSSTWLYQCPRQIGKTNRPDDVRGQPEGHFVVLRGYDRTRKVIHVADPWLANPFGTDCRVTGETANDYDVRIDRLTNSILLGVLTYDANLMIIQPVASGP